MSRVIRDGSGDPSYGGLRREQRFRAERFARFGGMTILEDADIREGRLVKRMEQALRQPARPAPSINLNGARCTADWLTSWIGAMASDGANHEV